MTTGIGDRLWPRYARFVQRPVLALSPSQWLLRGIFDGTTFLLAKRCAGVSATRATRGVPGLDLTPRTARAGRLLYLHGGGFTIGSSTSHRHMVAHIARAAGCATFLPDYRRAPEHPFPAALDDALAAYRALSAEGPVRVAGDSAGGGLALSLLHATARDGLPPPAALVLLSPVGDLDLAQGSFQRHTDTELLIPEGWARRAVAAYLRDHDPRDPLASPLAAPFPAAPPTLIQYATGEALAPDSQRSAEALRAAGGAVRLEATADVAHVWHLHAGRSHAADAAIARIGTFLREHAP